jgi:hypothetical protein
MGIPTALALADASEHLGHAFCAGRAEPRQFGCLADRLRDFLEFVVLAEDLLEGLDARVAVEVAGFRCRLLGAVDAVQAALDRACPGEVGLALSGALADTLGEYAGLGGNVAMTVRALPAAA